MSSGAAGSRALRQAGGVEGSGTPESLLVLCCSDEVSSGVTDNLKERARVTAVLTLSFFF